MTILRFLLLFIVLGSGILFLVRKLSFSQFLAPFVTIAGITSLLYVFSLVNFLKQGLIIIIVIMVGLGIFSFFNWPSKTLQENKKITAPLLAWSVIFLLTAIYTVGTLFYNWDEFSYWGVIYKYLLSTNHLPDMASNLVVSNYPPFTAIFQYFVGTVVKGSESSAYFAQILLSFSALIAILPNKNWKDWKKYLLILGVCYLSVFPFDLRFQTLYVDLMLGLLFGAGLASAAFNQNLSAERVTTVILASVALVLTKPLGIIFAVVNVAVLYFDFLFTKYQINSFKAFFVSLFKPLKNIKIIMVIGIVLLALISWSTHTKQVNTTKVNLSFNGVQVPSGDIYPGDTSYYLTKLEDEQTLFNKNVLLYKQPFEIDISVVNVLRIVTVNTPYRTKLILGNFLQGFSEHEFLTLKITCLTALLLILFFSILIRVTTKKDQENNSISRNTIILLIGFGVYAFAMLFAYIYYFQPTDGIQTPELSRYLSSFLLGWWLLVMSCLYQQESIEIPIINIKTSSLISVGLVFTYMLTIPFSAYFHTALSPSAQRFEINRIYKAISNKITNEDKVFDIWQVDESYGLNHYIMKYYLTPSASNNYGWRISPLDSSAENFVGGYGFVTKMSAVDWLKLLNDQQYTHVLVCTSDEDFWTGYGSLFDTFLDENVPQLFSVSPTGLVNIPIEVKY